jgi:oligoendopeptidase F
MLFSDVATTVAPAAKKIPTRAEIPAADTWNLDHLYPSVEAWEAALKHYQETYPKYAGFKGTLGTSAARLLEFLEWDRELDILAERLGHYASLQTSEDSSNNDYLSREARLQHTFTLAAEIAAFVTPEILALDEKTYAAFLKDPALKEWANRLQRMRRYKPHTLTENEERLLALASTPLRGHDETFSQLTNVDMKFGVIQDEHGREIEMSPGVFSSFLIKRDPALRKAAFEKYYAEFDDHKFTIASTLANSVKADVFLAKARNHVSAREASLFHDNMPVAVYDNLIASARAHLAPLHDYYELRREVLGLKEIHFYDTYVPLVGQIQVRTTFDEAIGKVLDSLHPLGAEYVGALGDGLRNRWCDRYETKGKRSGAFSSSSFGNPPYIMMNFKEDVFSDVYTLAHEAGHSMHTWFSQRKQPFQDYHYPIFLAEVASTFNEELLTHHLLEITEDPAMRAYIINRQIDDIRGTLYRQTMFAEFEKLVHAMEEAGEPLTLDSFRATYRGLLDAYHGPGMIIDPQLELECLRIPHFYSAFYVYKYSTGISAAVALSEQVLAEGKPAVERYLGFLQSGGSKFPLETLKAAGVDMTTAAPIEQTLKLFARRVTELRGLLKTL